MTFGDFLAIMDRRLLNCLDNQKYIHERNADSTTCDADAVQSDNQKAIDDFNRQCRELWLKGINDD